MQRGFFISLVLLAGITGVTLSLVGWQGKLPSYDHINHVYDSFAFLQDGTIPQKGIVISRGSFSPPGNTWLYLPGILLTDNSSLYESVGSGLLYIGTLLGIFLTVSRYAGNGPGLLSSLLFGFSSLGYSFADSLLGVGNPFFIVWMLYFISRWVIERDGRFLAGGFLLWGLGMYVFMTIAPALFIFPVLWLIFRPPLRLSYLFGACVILLIVWSPYLIFDGKQGFKNIISQVGRTYVIPKDFERTWNDPTLRPFLEDQRDGLDLAGRPSEIPAETIKESVKNIGIAISSKLSNLGFAIFINFNASTGYYPISKALNVILGLLVFTAALAGLSAPFRNLKKYFAGKRGFSVKPRYRMAIGFLLIAGGLVVNEFLLTRYMSKDGYLWPEEIAVIQQFQITSIILGLIMIFIGPIRKFLRPLWEAAEAEESRNFLTVLAVCFFVPGLLIAALAEPGTMRRFEWLWLFQSLILAYFFMRLLPRLFSNKGILFLLTAVLSVPLVWSVPFYTIRNWAENGFEGQKNPLRLSVEFIAAQVKRQGKNQVSLGYNIPFYGYNASFNVIDRRYKVGAVPDLILSAEFGIKNTDQFAEGISPKDEYRIVAPAPKGKSLISYIPLSGKGYKPVASFGRYQVLRKR